MGRYVDADELLMAFGEVRADYNCFNELERPRYEMWSNAIDFINTMAKSSIDIVRCKECKFREANKSIYRGAWYCSNHGDIVDLDDYCSLGERREP